MREPTYLQRILGEFELDYEFERFVKAWKLYHLGAEHQGVAHARAKYLLPLEEARKALPKKWNEAKSEALKQLELEGKIKREPWEKR